MCVTVAQIDRVGSARLISELCEALQDRTRLTDLRRQFLKNRRCVSRAASACLLLVVELPAMSGFRQVRRFSFDSRIELSENTAFTEQAGQPRGDSKLSLCKGVSTSTYAINVSRWICSPIEGA
jgi:hypothetical protein